MFKPLSIYSYSNYHHAVEDELPALKPILQTVSGKKIRRIDRFTQLALIGGLQCSANIDLPSDTGIYLSSLYGSINNTTAVLSDIYQQGQLPRPLGFINTVSNAACFYLAEQLGVSSCNQFVTRDHFTMEAGLKLASLDLELGNIMAALVGVVGEVGNSAEDHRQRLQIDKKYNVAEGSHWLYIAHELNGQQPIARITTIAEPLTTNELTRCLQTIIDENLLATAISFSDSIGAAEKRKILQQTDVEQTDYASQLLRHEFTTALHIHGFLDSDKVSEQTTRLIFIDKNDTDYWSVISIEK